MANNNKFDLNKYISFGYASYKEYEDASRDLGRDMLYLIIEDAYKYLELIKRGYKYILEDIQEILDISNNNTIQVKVMKDIDKVYINKPVKDLLYMATGKTYNRISDIQKYTGINESDLKLFYPELVSLCEELGVTPNFLIKKTFMKADDIENIIRDLFKREIVSDKKLDDDTLIKEISYTDITDYEMKLIMQGNLKSDKTLREQLGFSNLNQLQRRLNGSHNPKRKESSLFGYKGRFVMANEGSRRPLVRYLFDPNVLSEE